jgi:ATP-dependent DNA ligase
VSTTSVVGHAGRLPGVRLNEHIAHPKSALVFQHAKLGAEGIVSKRLGSRYRSGAPDRLKFKNPEAPAVKREAEVDWR